MAVCIVCPLFGNPPRMASFRFSLSGPAASQGPQTFITHPKTDVVGGMGSGISASSTSGVAGAAVYYKYSEETQRLERARKYLVVDVQRQKGSRPSPTAEDQSITPPTFTPARRKAASDAVDSAAPHARPPHPSPVPSPWEHQAHDDDGDEVEFAPPEEQHEEGDHSLMLAKIRNERLRQQGVRRPMLRPTGSMAPYAIDFPG